MSGKEAEITLLIVIVVVGSIILGSGLFPLVTMGRYGWGETMCSGVGSGMMNYRGFGYGWMTPWVVILTIVIIIGIYFIITGFKRREEAPQVLSPLELLKERYARGEITSEEFKKIREDLEV